MSNHADRERERRAALLRKIDATPVVDTMAAFVQRTQLRPWIDRHSDEPRLCCVGEDGRQHAFALAQRDLADLIKSALVALEHYNHQRMTALGSNNR